MTDLVQAVLLADLSEFYYPFIVTSLLSFSFINNEPLGLTRLFNKILISQDTWGDVPRGL